MWLGRNEKLAAKNYLPPHSLPPPPAMLSLGDSRRDEEVNPLVREQTQPRFAAPHSTATLVWDTSRMKSLAAGPPATVSLPPGLRYIRPGERGADRGRAATPRRPGDSCRRVSWPECPSCRSQTVAAPLESPQAAKRGKVFRECPHAADTHHTFSPFFFISLG